MINIVMVYDNKQDNDYGIFIISQLSLETDLITYMVQKELNIICHVFDQELNIFPDTYIKESVDKSELKESSLILIDREIHNFRNIIQEVSCNRFCSKSKIAIFNINEKTTVEKELLTKQVRGIFYKDDHLDTFLKGIKATLSNEVWISREMLLQYIFDDSKIRKRDFERSNNLTKREIEILTLVSMGSSNDEIADKVFISTNTVKTHLYNIFKKIDVQNRIQAALWAAKKL
ncbi:MAG: response regulator transcription factor [Spirochaetaceae bacterium]|nr:response regulator transcription factor [Spirochaetaceae bacterium]